MLAVTIYKMSNASGFHPVAESRHEHQGSQSEQLRNLATFLSNTAKPLQWLGVIPVITFRPIKVEGFSNPIKKQKVS